MKLCRFSNLTIQMIVDRDYKHVVPCRTYELEVPANTPYSYCSVKSATGPGKQILYTSNDTDFTYFYDLRVGKLPGLRYQVTIFGRFNINSETGNPQVDAVYIVVYPPSSYRGYRYAWYYIIHNDGEVRFKQLNREIDSRNAIKHH
ncbi:uncharacterized protein LOC141907636 isoform X1 [Tubulanus polymorphus]|uniref:uncharacterized protein LOC141907636 isoform X1 n=1 Tax=Tubulanus polymorphus TaxID=672921 RepID=UPI003DA5DF02